MSAAVIAGKVQAHVMNFEEVVIDRFGRKEGLGDDLRFPVFVSSLTADAVEALKRTHRRLPKKPTTFIREHDASLPLDVQSDWRYDFRVLLLPQTGPKTEADAVMRFVREEELTDEQRQARDVVQTIVRTRQIPVQNQGRHKPGGVAREVETQLGVRFRISDHTAAWRHYGVRPAQGADRPELTNTTYCVYDEPHSDYLYTDAWIRNLVRDLGDAAAFEAVLGRPPRPIRA